MTSTRLRGIRPASRNSVLCAVLFASMFLMPESHAQQWTVVNLHPKGADHSYAYAFDDGRQIGWVDWHAGFWSGSAESWVELHPAEAEDSYAYGAGAGQQVGVVHVNGADLASLWTGSPASWVSLHPSSAEWSEALGAADGQQVGYATFKGDWDEVDHAAFWSGTAASWVDLHPPGLPDSTHSIAHDTDSVQQVGYTKAGGGPFVVFRALMWTGDADSWVSLHPAGMHSSNAFGVHGGQQVGRVRVEMVGGFKAALWTGTAESWVNLNPPDASGSTALDVYDGQQVGVATIGGVIRAGLWSGTADSWVDLHAFLPLDFAWSEARGIWHDASATYVVGYAANTTTARIEALMWVRSMPCPGDIDGDGQTCQRDLGILLGAYGSCEGDPNYDPNANLSLATTCPSAPGEQVIDQSDLGVLLGAYGCGDCP